MITKSLDSDEELLRFINNAEKYGHQLDCVITAFAQQLDPRVEHSIRKKLPFYAIDIKYPRFCLERFRRIEVSDSATKMLLDTPMEMQRGMVPYGFNRTIVLVEAILRGIDILFFVDSDVYPSVLKKTEEGTVIEEVDFFGAHLEHLNAGSMVTTGEYSGYNILPPAVFDGMEDLLVGLQKADMLEYWESSEKHRCLSFQKPERVAKPCSKILGGNSAIKLSVFKRLPPFFSSYYSVGGELFLSRGEDTILGAEIAKTGTTCTDIGLNPLHDTYKGYPMEPDLQGGFGTQDRFYYACTGWVGRNPFLNYMRGEDLKWSREFQRERLMRGLRALAEYTSNPRYYSVMRNYEVSWDSLGRYISEYERVLDAWDEFLERSDLS